VRYLGYVPGADLPGLTAGATALFYSSLYEGFGHSRRPSPNGELDGGDSARRTTADFAVRDGASVARHRVHPHELRLPADTGLVG
jgi:hypothetical protein